MGQLAYATARPVQEIIPEGDIRVARQADSVSAATVADAVDAACGPGQSCHCVTAADGTTLTYCVELRRVPSPDPAYVILERHTWPVDATGQPSGPALPPERIGAPLAALAAGTITLDDLRAQEAAVAGVHHLAHAAVVAGLDALPWAEPPTDPALSA